MHLLLVRVGNGKKLVQNRNFAPIIWVYFGVTTILPYFVASSFLLPSATTRRAFKSREWKSDCQIIIYLRTPHFCYFERIPSCPFPENQKHAPGGFVAESTNCVAMVSPCWMLKLVMPSDTAIPTAWSDSISFVHFLLFHWKLS